MTNTVNVMGVRIETYTGALAMGIAYLDAQRTSRGYRYHAPETRKDYRVSVRDVRKLGEALLADQSGDYDVYSQWCSSTTCKELAR
jgi:hypothetical protein